jgi:tetratricopeptide (TPR) repeat protein
MLSKKNLTAFFIFLMLVILSPVVANAQRQKADSMQRLLEKETIDSNRVTILWRMAGYTYIFNPDTALNLAQNALILARNIGFKEGESRSLGVIANTFLRLGNYPRALEFQLQKLKLEEKRNSPRNLAIVLLNIGVVYVSQEEYRKALDYYIKSDSVIAAHNIEDLKFSSSLNIGDAYDKLDILDSAFLFYNTSLKEAQKLKDEDFIGASLIGLGHIYRKQSNFLLADSSYKMAIKPLAAANDDDLLCEVYLGLAKLYEMFKKENEAAIHATTSYQIANKGGFEQRQLDAVTFLSRLYKKINKIDSAYAYLSIQQSVNDSINSKVRIKESQLMSSNEQIRQLEMAENKRIQEKERSQRLQMLVIAIFIPGFFMLTLLLSRVRLHVRLIRLLGVLSLLIFFEFLTLLLHPTIAELTHHTPIYEILIFVCVAAILIPLHHRAEHWLIHKLLHHRVAHADQQKKPIAKENTKA